MTSGIPHGPGVINKRLEEKGGKGETDLQSAAIVFCFSAAAECFIAQCAVPIFSSCRDYSNQAPALKKHHIPGLQKRGRTSRGRAPRLCLPASSAEDGGRRKSDSSHPCHHDRREINQCHKLPGTTARRSEESGRLSGSIRKRHCCIICSTELIGNKTSPSTVCRRGSDCGRDLKPPLSSQPRTAAQTRTHARTCSA